MRTFFKSNCLLEAIYAKLRHPIKTKIRILRTKKIPFHFMWEFEGKEYGFEGGGDGSEKPCLYPIWYKGEITEHPRGWIRRVKAASKALEEITNKHA